jgi:4-amino-4-deoxy-L-arabinose transferase-like glycosyltransferase
MRTDAANEPPDVPGAPVIARRVWLPVLLLIVLGTALYLPRLGASGLWDPWEPKYAQSAREMAEESDWVIPHYRKDERLNKVPLTYWLIAASHAVVGVNETAARLPSALLAILGAAALGFAFAARGRPLEAFLAGAALLTAPQWALTGRFATPDMPLAAFLGIALAVVLFLPSASNPRAARFATMLLIGLVAAAGLTDWPRGLLLPAWAALGWGAVRWNWKGPIALLAVAAVYHTAQLQYSVPLNLLAIGLAIVLAALVLRVRAGVPLFAIVVGVLVVALLVAPWIFVARHAEPNEFSLFRYKYAFNLGETEGDYTKPYVYTLRTVAIGGMPWTALAVIGLIVGLRRRRDETAGVLAGALIGAVGFFTLSEAGMGHFYAVVQPAVAGLAGIGAVAAMRRLGWSAVPAAAVLLALVSVVWQRPERILETATVKSNLYHVQLTLAVVSLIVAWVLTLAAAKIRGRESWVVASVVPAALLAGALGMWTVPALEMRKTLKPLWSLYLERRDGDEPLGVWGRAKDSIFYYSNNAVERLSDGEEFLEFLARPGPKFLVTTTRAIDSPMRTVPGRWDDMSGEHPTHRLVRYEPPPPSD